MRAKLIWRMNEDTSLEIEANNPIEAIEILSAYSEVFGLTECGKCGSENVRPEHRLASGYNFYSIRCEACGCTYDFGQHREGDTLFRKRDRGWAKYVPGGEGSGRAAKANDKFAETSSLETPF